MSSHAHDFDFLRGAWRVHHRKLRRRLAGSNDWMEFAGTVVSRPILGGAGNFDDNVIFEPGCEYRALALRRYSERERRWSIWWVDARFMRLEPPVHGRIERGVGTFLGDDAHEGRPILVRFIWSGVTPHAARWEQAFSLDRGVTWETNWVMDLERTG
jgi:hypothetical protein